MQAMPWVCERMPTASACVGGSPCMQARAFSVEDARQRLLPVARQAIAYGALDFFSKVGFGAAVMACLPVITGNPVTQGCARHSEPVSWLPCPCACTPLCLPGPYSEYQLCTQRPGEHMLTMLQAQTLQPESIHARTSCYKSGYHGRKVHRWLAAQACSCCLLSSGAC